MTGVTDFTGMSSESEGRIYQRREDDPTFIEQRSHEDFAKWVSAHQDQVQKLICNSREFKGERFCGEVYSGPLEETFFW